MENSLLFVNLPDFDLTLEGWFFLAIATLIAILLGTYLIDLFDKQRTIKFKFAILAACISFALIFLSIVKNYGTTLVTVSGILCSQGPA